MKIVILCGGEGTRMKEETEFKPKPLVLVGGKPILWHIMKIYSHYGFNEFVLALGYKGDMIKDYFLNWRTLANNFTLNTKNHDIQFHNSNQDDFKITFVDTGLKSLTGERLLQLKDFITEDDFFLTYGDGVADIDIKKLLEFHKSQNSIGTITGVNPLTKYGIVHQSEETKKVIGFSQNLVGDFVDKEDRHDFLINGGFMVFKKDIFNSIEPNSMIEKAFIPLVKKGELSLHHHLGKWKAMDTYKDVEEMNELWQKDPFWKVWKE
jgi:glucose-1-phosphate cytidylyltransferase